MGGLQNPSPIEVQDEGVVLTHTRKFDFVGAGVTGSVSADKVIVEIPGGVASGGGMATHSIGGTWHSDGTVSSPADMEVIAYEAATSVFKNRKIHGDIIKVADFHGGGTLALTLGSLAGRLVASQHPEVDHYTGGISPLTVGSLPGNLDHVYQAIGTVTNWRTLHVGSAGAHHTYPLPSGGIASGAVPLAECRGTLTPSQHPSTDHHLSGMSTLYHKRAPAWFIAGTLGVGSQLSARLMADGPWTSLDVFAHSRVPPSGGKIAIDIKKAGTSIFASLPYITTGTIYAGVYSFATTGVPSGAKLTLDISEVGSSHAGEHLTIQLVCKEPVL